MKLQKAQRELQDLAGIGRDVPTEESEDDGCPNYQAVNNKDSRGVGSEETQQKPNRGIANHARYDCRHNQRQVTTVRQFVDCFLELKYAAGRDCRNRKQEGKPRGRFPRQTGE